MQVSGKMSIIENRALIKGNALDTIAFFHKGISSAILRFQKNPFDFLYERDLQGLLFSSLLDAFSGHVIEMNGGYHSVGAYGDVCTIQTVPIKCEYPGNEKFDVALLDHEALRVFDHRIAREEGWKNDVFWNQPVRAAVEIKYCQLNDNLRHRRDGVNSDIEKLRKYSQSRERPFLGISILFIQPANINLSTFIDGNEMNDDPIEGITKYIVSQKEYRKIEVGF